MGMVYEFLPFMILPIYTSLEKIDGWLLFEAAADLGANALRTLFARDLAALHAWCRSRHDFNFIPVIGTFVVSDILGGRQVVFGGQPDSTPVFGSAQSTFWLGGLDHSHGHDPVVYPLLHPPLWLWRGDHSRMNRRSPWLTLSALAVYFFLYAPIVVLILYSFNASRTNVVFEGVVNRGPCDLYWFCRLAENDDVLDATRNTLLIAITSTIVATLIGTMAALALQRYQFPFKQFSEATLYVPIVIPEIVMGIGILVFLQRGLWLAQQQFRLTRRSAFSRRAAYCDRLAHCL